MASEMASEIQILHTQLNSAVSQVAQLLLNSAWYMLHVYGVTDQSLYNAVELPNSSLQEEYDSLVASTVHLIQELTDDVRQKVRGL